MISTIFLMTMFLALQVSAESVVTTVIGGLAAFGATHFVKHATGLTGVGAVLLAYVVSFAVAIGALIVTTQMGGENFTWEMIPQNSLQIFGLATLAYKMLMADQPSRS